MKTMLRAAWLLPFVLPSVVTAQPTVRVGEIVAESECQAFVGCWGLWILVECRNNFAPMQARLQSALHESGRFSAAGAGRGDYVATGRVTEMGLVSSTASGRDYQLSGSRAVATLDLLVQERSSNRTIYAGTVSASVDAGSGISTDGSSFTEERNARAVYAELQRELALSASRAAAFAVEPLRVTAVSGRQVRLNYGAPLLTLDASVQVADVSGFPVQYRVTGVMPDGAVAEAAVPVSVAPGALASVIDARDAPGGMNRFPRVELPRN